MSEKIESMRRIADWVTQYGWDAYYDQKNNDGYPVFHANTGSKPDILLQKGNYNVLVEIKPCKKHKDLLDGMEQTIEYTGEYYTGRTQYRTKKEEDLTIDAFVLGTNHSKSGYLYQDEGSLNFVESSYLARHEDMIEKPITHSATRFLWRQWEKGLAHDHYEVLRANRIGDDVVLPSRKPRVGTLLAKTHKRNRQIGKEPYLYLNSNEFASMEEEQIYALH